MKKIGLILLLTFGAIILLSSKVSATHTAGMDMFYRWKPATNNDSSYEFTLVFYRNCQGFTAGAPGSITIQASAPSINQTGSFPAPGLPTTGTGVPPLQPANMYNCTQSQNSLCYEEYVYRGTWNSPARASDWKFNYQLCCRPNTNAPTNMANGTQYIECGLNNLDFPDHTAKNWSPLWHNRRPNHPGYTTDTLINFLFRTLCAYNLYTIDMGAREYQGDSVSYGFYHPQTAGGAPNAYLGAWNLTYPMPSFPPNVPLTINPVTGVIPFTPGPPTGTGIYVLGIEAKEWRYDTIVSGGVFVRVAKQIGYIRRDMTIWIDDTTNCRRDSVHPKNVTFNNGGGGTTLDVFFSAGIPGDPDSRVRCETLSPDGSEFRVMDSSNYVAPFDTTVRSIGVYKATWTCYAGLTDRVTLHLAEPLRCQKYYIYMKIGTDLDVIESECGFLEPDSTSGVITVTKNVNVKIDTTSRLHYCLPTENPFPKLRATSTDSSSFPLDYYWAYRCDTCPNNAYDTIEGQDVPFMWAKQPGWYEVRVRDPLNCTGKRRIELVYDTVPEFFMPFPLYCDKFGEAPGLPDFLVAPDDPDVYLWTWESSVLGEVGTGDTIRVPALIEGMKYKLIGEKFPKKPWVQPDSRCRSEFEFVYSRDSFPPQDPLYVKFMEESTELCLSDADTGLIEVWSGGVRDKYAPLFVQWYLDTMPIPGTTLKKVIRDTGLYIVTVQDSLGCWGMDTTRVTQAERLPGPVIPCTVTGAAGIFSFVWPEGAPIYQNQVSLDGGLTWIDANNGYFHIVGNVEAQKSIMAKGLVHSACYETEISTSLECPDDVFPPNVMTPNGDGLNDFFDVSGLELFDNSKVKVFDRWGNEVFSSSNYKNTWDGGDLPEGTYFYVLEVDDPTGTVHKGILTILR